MPVSLSRSAQRDIVSLKLPGGLTALPQWVSSLPSLKRLEIPGFAGRHLEVDLPQIEEVHVSGQSVRSVGVPARAEVYCRDGYAHHQERIEVRYRDLASGRVVWKAAAIGHTYRVARADGKINYRNLNGAGEFRDGYKHLAGGVPIVCRHLATHWIHKVQAYRARGHALRFVDGWSRTLSRAQDIAASVSPYTHARYYELAHRSPETIMVGESQWGAFLRTEFARLPAGAHKHFIVRTPVHAMAVELSVIGTPRGKRYAFTLYDPNLTTTTTRILEDDLNQIGLWQIHHFMCDADIRAYYGDRNSPAITLFVPIPPDAHTRPMNARLFARSTGSRRLREFLSSAELASPQAAFQLFHSHHATARNLRRRLALCATPARKVALLTAARSIDGTPGLFMSSQGGDADSIYAVHEVAKELLALGEMTNKEFASVIEARRPGRAPGLFMACQLNHPAALRAQGAVVSEGLSTTRLTAQDAERILAGRLDNGFPALFPPLQDGYVEVILTMGDLLDDPAISNALTNEQRAEILAARDEDGAPNIAHGTPGFYATMQNNRAEAARAFGAVIARLRSRGLLTNEQVFDLLEGYSRMRGKSALGIALFHGRTESIRVIGDLLADPTIAESLTNSQIERLLTPRLPDGTPVIQAMDKASHPEAIEAFRQVVLDAYRRGQISDARAARILHGTLRTW